MRRHLPLWSPCWLLWLCLWQSWPRGHDAFAPSCPYYYYSQNYNHPSTITTRLSMSGDGIAETYSWHEEAFEIEVSVPVPKETRPKDIHFRATPTSVELRLQKKDGNDIVLLDPTRALRGKVSLEGTFWVISDPDEDKSQRIVTVTIEKQIRRPKDDFDVIEYDWKGLYFQEFENEVSHRRYDEPEALDVREYAASLGVDIDNINMSMVDKDMFSSGLNLTKSSMDSLKEAGLMQEVTRQNDGSEWITNEDGEQIPFNSMGGTTADGQDPTMTASSDDEKPTIPFLDTNSPWHKAVPVDKKDEFLESTEAQQVQSTTSLSEKEKQRMEKAKELQKQRELQATDPIEALTVARLKEILRARGLKVTGNKKELQDRLRAEVTTMMDNNDDDDDPPVV